MCNKRSCFPDWDEAEMARGRGVALARIGELDWRWDIYALQADTPNSLEEFKLGSIGQWVWIH